MQVCRAQACCGWLALLALLGCAVPTPEPLPAPEASREPAAAPGRVAPPPCARIVSMQVYKGRRMLEARCERGAIVVMTVAVGRDPLGPKRGAGDSRTPEGSYRVTGPLRPSRFHGFIPLDYPSMGDADAALADGRISPADHRRIVRAHARGLHPPGDTPIGGDIGFHGEGERWRGDSQQLDWTHGCLAVPDEALDFISERVTVGVPVDIFP
jgi:murein L,D-transpeptidase YafK